MRGFGNGHEQHSADGQTFLEKVKGGWGIWFEGARIAFTYTTRERAREHIRELKRGCQHVWTATRHALMRCTKCNVARIQLRIERAKETNRG